MYVQLYIYACGGRGLDGLAEGNGQAARGERWGWPAVGSWRAAGCGGPADGGGQRAANICCSRSANHISVHCARTVHNGLYIYIYILYIQSVYEIQSIHNIYIASHLLNVHIVTTLSPYKA